VDDNATWQCEPAKARVSSINQVNGTTGIRKCEASGLFLINRGDCTSCQTVSVLKLVTEESTRLTSSTEEEGTGETIVKNQTWGKVRSTTWTKVMLVSDNQTGSLALGYP
jgi:hypothetical protein